MKVTSSDIGIEMMQMAFFVLKVSSMAMKMRMEDRDDDDLVDNDGKLPETYHED